MSKEKKVDPSVPTESVLVDGREVLCPVPVAPPIGHNPQPSLAERIRDMVRSEQLRVAAEQMGHETFEEADDFDIGDDYDPESPYEEDFEPVPVSELRRRAAADNGGMPSPVADQSPSGDEGSNGRGAADRQVASGRSSGGQGNSSVARTDGDGPSRAGATSEPSGSGQ